MQYASPCGLISRRCLLSRCVEGKGEIKLAHATFGWEKDRLLWAVPSDLGG